MNLPSQWFALQLNEEFLLVKDFYFFDIIVLPVYNFCYNNVWVWHCTGKFVYLALRCKIIVLVSFLSSIRYCITFFCYTWNCWNLWACYVFAFHITRWMHRNYLLESFYHNGNILEGTFLVVNTGREWQDFFELTPPAERIRLLDWSQWAEKTSFL